MTSALQERETVNFGGGSGGFGMGGALGGILLAIIVLWFLIRDGHNDNGHNNYYGGGHGYPGYTPDMPGYMVDKDVISQGCITRATEVCEAEKTRSLIVHETERQADKEYYSNLINNQAILAAKDSKIQGLEAMIYGNTQFNMLEKQIGKIECEVSKLPHIQPEYASTVTPLCRPLNDYPHQNNNCYA